MLSLRQKQFYLCYSWTQFAWPVLKYDGYAAHLSGNLFHVANNHTCICQNLKPLLIFYPTATQTTLMQIVLISLSPSLTFWACVFNRRCGGCQAVTPCSNFPLHSFHWPKWLLPQSRGDFFLFRVGLEPAEELLWLSQKFLNLPFQTVTSITC